MAADAQTGEGMVVKVLALAMVLGATNAAVAPMQQADSPVITAPPLQDAQSMGQAIQQAVDEADAKRLKKERQAAEAAAARVKAPVLEGCCTLPELAELPDVAEQPKRPSQRFPWLEPSVLPNQASEGPPPESTWLEWLASPQGVSVVLGAALFAWLIFALVRQAWRTRS